MPFSGTLVDTRDWPANTQNRTGIQVYLRCGHCGREYAAFGQAVGLDLLIARAVKHADQEHDGEIR